MRAVELAALDVPAFGSPKFVPHVPPEEYEARVQELRRRMEKAGLDFVAVYGDREHAANVAFLTGYDPRFEETLVVLGRSGRPMLLVGNEGLGYSPVCQIDCDIVLYQTFSLLGQPRDRSNSLSALLRDYGIGPGSHVGVAGWKYFDSRESAEPELWLEVPAFIVDTLRELTGSRASVTNATALFMDPGNGLRTTNSAHQIAHFEAVSTYCSQAVRNEIAGLRPGMTEYQAVQLMGLNGIPLSCHTMLGSGERARLGLMSPSDRVLQVGDPFTTCLGLQGALTARAGFLVHGADELPEGAEDYVTRIVAPYYAAAVTWWESLSIGASAAEITGKISGYLAEQGVGLALNPGHLLHLDEWLHSPFYTGSPHSLRSGMVLQCDIIPTPPAPYAPSNVEDGLALADETLRDEIARTYPETWSRIAARREFMQDVLGIRLQPEVLPFSNWPCVLTPYLLSPNQAMRVAA